jgi:hypothetical protein
MRSQIETGTKDAHPDARFVSRAKSKYSFLVVSAFKMHIPFLKNLIVFLHQTDCLDIWVQISTCRIFAQLDLRLQKGILLVEELPHRSQGRWKSCIVMFLIDRHLNAREQTSSHNLLEPCTGKGGPTGRLLGARVLYTFSAARPSPCFRQASKKYSFALLYSAQMLTIRVLIPSIERTQVFVYRLSIAIGSHQRVE